jgi:hypothetical protein
VVLFKSFSTYKIMFFRQTLLHGLGLIDFIAAKRHTSPVALRRGDAARAQVERTWRAPSQEGVWPRIAAAPVHQAF